MFDDTKAKQLAKKLLKHSYKNASICSTYVGHVLEGLSSMPDSRKKQVLKHYKVLIAQALSQEHALVEYAGDISSATLDELKIMLKEHYGRPVDLSLSENEDLIAGLKIRISDDIWESSIASQLETLAQSIQ